MKLEKGKEGATGFDGKFPTETGVLQKAKNVRGARRRIYSVDRRDSNGYEWNCDRWMDGQTDGP